MFPPIKTLLQADSTVVGYLGTNRIRVYPFAESPQDGPYPYAVWQVITAAPENTLSCTPDIDAVSVQIDVYSKDHEEALAVSEAIRDVLELDAHMTGYGNTERMPTTRAFRISMDFQFWLNR